MKDKMAKTQSDLCTKLLILTLFIRTKDWKQPKLPSTEEWLKKVCGVVHIYYSAEKKKKRTKFDYL